MNNKYVNLVGTLPKYNDKPVELKDINPNFPILKKEKLLKVILEVQETEWDIESEKDALKYAKRLGSIFNTFKRNPKIIGNREFYLPFIEFKYKVIW